MTFPRLNALLNYWAKHPPIHFLVAGLVGHKPPAEKKQNNDLGELIEIFGQMGGQVLK